jgi:hypothetical protein
MAVPRAGSGVRGTLARSSSSVEMARWPTLLLLTTVPPVDVPVHGAHPNARRQRLTRRTIDARWRVRIAVILTSGLLLAAARAGAQTTTTSTTSTTIIVGGGGSPVTDCLFVFRAAPNTPPSRPRNFHCTDGSDCDADHTINGMCEFPIEVCANSTFDPRCTLNGVFTITVDHADDNCLDPEFDTEFQALQNAIAAVINPPTNAAVCTPVVNIHVPVNGPLNGTCHRAKKRLGITTESEEIAGLNDRDRMRFICDPDPNVCDPMVYFAGAFDRIQRQIFNQHCALGGCHVSNCQPQAGYLNLESSSSYPALFNHDPFNANALAAHWKRVAVPMPGVGDLSISLLFHKINRFTLPANFGDPMPRGKPRLDQALINIVQAWIEGGAPDTGWPQGTDQ